MNTSRRAEPASRIFDVTMIVRELGSKVGQGARRLQRSIRTSRDRAALHAMPDHMLKDMGIPRCEILFLTGSRETGSTGRLRSSGK